MDQNVNNQVMQGGTQGANSQVVPQAQPQAQQPQQQVNAQEIFQNNNVDFVEDVLDNRATNKKEKKSFTFIIVIFVLIAVFIFFLPLITQFIQVTFG